MKKSRIFSLILSSLTSALVLSLASCSSAPKKFESGKIYTPTAMATPQVASLSEDKILAKDAAYREMQDLYKRAQYEAVIGKASDYEKKNRNSPHLSYVRNMKGLAYLATRRPLLAIAQFQRALDYNVNHYIKPYLQYNLAAALGDADQTDDSIETLKEIQPTGLNTETRAKFYSLMAKNQLSKNQWQDSARSTLQASLILGPSLGQKPALVEQLDRAITQITKQEELNGILVGLEASPLADRVKAKLQPGLALDAPALTSTGDSRSIGVLLPLSGKFAQYGERALKAISMALKVYGDSPRDYTLQIEDAGETVEQSLRALNRLANQKHVSVVIGPLLSKGIDQITSRAEVLGMPLITLTQQPGVKGEYAFSAGLTPKLQSNEIAKYAIEKLGLKKFAIIYPKDRFGEQYSQSYWDAVESLGGEIVGIESYAPGETDFRQVIDRLAGTYYTEARQRELDDLAKQRDALKITKKTRKTVQYFDLKPLAQFDAVFIPDEPKVVSLILPTFAYRDLDNVKFLGVSTWNSPELIQRAANFVEKSAFVDGLFFDSSSPASQKFIAEYMKDTNEAPTTIEAMAYDAGLVVDQTLQKFSPGTVDRSTVRNQLRNVSGLMGATGRISYRDGELARTLTLLTVEGGKITELK
jgi:ABC-type branched-subunit amino acid transport system substrate-binding protein